MSYNKNSRRTGARASAVPLPPPPSLTDLAEWPYLESSAARARTRNASATATGGNNRAQQRLGSVNEGGSLQQQAAVEHEAHDDSAVTEQGTTNLPEQAVLEPEAQVGTAIPRGSGTLAQQMPPEQQQPGESFQEFVDRHRRLALSVPVTWEDDHPSSLAPPNGDEPPPNIGAGATRPARDADSAPFPAEWWAALPEGLSPDKANAVWLEKGRPYCTVCGRAHPPPHSNLVARQNKQQRRQQKLEHRAKQEAAAAAAAAPEVKKEPEEAERCQRCGNFHLSPCKAPWCDKCGSAHFKKKGEPCKKRMEEQHQQQQQPRRRRGGRGSRRRSRGRSASPRREDASGGMPSAEQQRRNIKAAILACRTEAQAKFWIDLLSEHAPGLELPEQQGQQQQQQDRPPPRQNQRGSSSNRPRGRSASPRREDFGGGSGGGYRERSPNTRRNAKKRGGRGPG